MISRLKTWNQNYPHQYWILFWGTLLVAVGNSMTWPFLTVYLRQTFQIPLTLVASFLTIRSVSGLFSSFFAGPIADKFGRKWLVVLSLLITGLCYFMMARANTIALWIILMIVYGAFHPIFRVGADAMIADMVSVEKRLDAYSMMRIIQNLGISLGPIIGGVLAAISYSRAFTGGSLALITFGVISLLFISETLQLQTSKEISIDDSPDRYGYDYLIKDTKFITFILMFTITSMCAMIMFILLPVYIKENFGLSESYFGWIIATNGLMIVFLQFPIAQFAKKFSGFSVLAVGAVLYGLGLGSVALGTNFWMFVLSMVIMTLGELIMVPTATTMTANMAPTDMRGRYMGLFSLTHTIGVGVGPVAGGLFNDLISPVAIWYGGLAFGLVSALGFYFLYKKYPDIKSAPSYSNIGS